MAAVQASSFKAALHDTGTDTGRLIAELDWSATSLGAIEGWPRSLTTMLGFLLRSSVPIVMLWGEDGVMLYNDAYSAFAGGRHPRLLGSKVREGWPEVADFNDNVMRVGLAGGTLAYRDQELTLFRHGRPEQVFMNLDYSPVPGDDGAPAGVIAVVIETTARVAAERQRDATEAALRAERDRARDVLDNMGEAFALIDGDLRLLDMNAEALRLERRPREALIGRTHDELHPDADPALGRLFRQAFAERRAVSLEHRYVWPHGRESWIEMRAYPVEAGVAVFYRDVTARRSAEAALKASEERFRFALDAAGGIGTWDWDVAADRVFTSAGFAEMYGLDPTAATEGMPVGDYVAGIHADDRAEVFRLIGEAVRQGGEYRAEYRIVGRDGEARWVIARGHCLRDADGRPTRFPGVTFDITDRKRAEERLRLSETRLRFLSAMDEGLRASRDAPAAMLAAAGLLARHLGASRCAYADVDADSDRFVIRNDFTAPGVATSAGIYSLDLFGPRAAADMRAGRTLVVREVGRELAPGEGREMFQAIGIEAIVCCPLVRDGRLVAMMAVHQDGPRDWSADEIGLVEATVERCWVHVERVGAAARLAESEERLRLAVENAEVGFWDVDLVNDALIWPPRTKAMFGISAGVPVTLRDFYDGLHPEDAAATSEAFAAAADPARRALYDVEYRTVGREDAMVRWVAAKGRGLFDEAGRCIRVLGTAIDVTARKAIEARIRELNENLERRVEAEVAERAKAEEQLRQAQKMEAVGQLTGGIAHDFNNLLTGVIGSLDMMQRRIAKGDTQRIERYATAAMTSANRAAALTHRLLAFSRRQPLDPKPVSANRLVTGMEELLRRTLGEAVRLEIVTAGGLWQTRCDPHQLESAILNLAINGRDAMPAGGTLTIETCNAHLDNAYAALSREVQPGQYVCICVTDTGTGMTPDVIAKAFDPFFTTKPIGQGTGLGLSMVYGFARQSEGYARIYSEPAQGTTVKLYLPRYYGEAEGEEEGARELTEAHRAEAGEVVLVVEDETAVRDLVADVLGELGYRAVEAADGPSGLKLVESGMRIDLLVTDVGLPGLNGRQLADRARERRPGLKVLFMTGYAENAAVANGFLEPGMEMITKPFAIEALATRIRDMIERG